VAFPVVESITANNATGGAATAGDTAATSHVVTLPATISAGALLLIVGRVTVVGAVAVTGGGWTIVQDATDASDDTSFWMYRNAVADGTEDGTTITITHGSGKLACGAMSITGAEPPATQAPQTSTIAIGTGTAPSPTTCTPTGGAKDYLWIALGLCDGEQTCPPGTIPASYGASAGWTTGVAGIAVTNAIVFTATRNLNAASEDAGTWTLSAAPTGWTSWCIAVHPASAAGWTASQLIDNEPVRLVPSRVRPAAVAY
jgi:hypothetical protein